MRRLDAPTPEAAGRSPRRRGAWRRASAPGLPVRQGAGLLLLALLWAGPLPALAPVAMTAHMVLHVGVIAVVPALLAPRLAAAPAAGVLIAAGAAELLVVWAWHLPVAHRFAALSDTGFALEQASYLAAGLAVWSAAEAAGRLAGALLLMTTGMHMTLIGALLTLAPTVLYPGLCGGGPLGLSPLEDQQMAGIVMAVFAPLLYWGAGLARLAPLLAEEEAR